MRQPQILESHHDWSRTVFLLAAANNSASTDGFKFDTEAALEPRETRPVRIKPAAVLAAVKARPLGVRASGKLCVPAGLDGVCARRPRSSAVGAGEEPAARSNRGIERKKEAPLGRSTWVAERGLAEEI